MRSAARLPLYALALLAAACTTTQLAAIHGRPNAVPSAPDVALTVPPYSVVHVDWKQRVEQPYVFLELLGDYRQVGRWIPLLIEHAAAQGVAVAGPPFALYYDDPARVASADLRARVALPVAPGSAPATAPLGMDVLPAADVVYARVGGAYSEVHRSHAGMFSFLRDRGWAVSGPIREIYLVNPAHVKSFDELVTEVQMPWRTVF